MKMVGKLYSAREFGLAVVRDYPHYELLRCPFHDDQNPSALFIKNVPMIKCQSCGAKVVGAEELSKKLGVEGIVAESGPPSIAFLERGGLNEPWMVDVTSNEDAQSYLESRLIDPQFVNLFYSSYVRWAPYEEALAFLARNSAFKTVGISLRHTSKAAFSRYEVRGRLAPLWPKVYDLQNTMPLFVFEGPFKLLSFAQAAYNTSMTEHIHCVCTMGSHMTNSIKASLMSSHASKIVLIADNDYAGLRFAQRFEEQIANSQVFVPDIPFDEQNEFQARSTLDFIYSEVEKNHEPAIHFG